MSTKTDTRTAGAESLACLTRNLRLLQGPAWTWDLLHTYAILDALFDVLRDIAENEIRTLDALDAYYDADPNGTEYFVTELQVSHAMFQDAVRLGTGPDTGVFWSASDGSGSFQKIWHVIKGADFLPSDERFASIEQVLRRVGVGESTRSGR